MSKTDNDAVNLYKHLNATVNGDKTDEAPAPPVEEPNYFEGVDKKDVSEGKELFSKVFGWKPASGDFHITVFNTEHEDVPQATAYLFPREETEMFVRALENGMKPRLVGDPGTGKRIRVALDSRFARRRVFGFWGGCRFHSWLLNRICVRLRWCIG